MTAIFLLCPGRPDSVIWTCPARVYPTPPQGGRNGSYQECQLSLTAGASWNAGSTGALRPVEARCCDALVTSALAVDGGGRRLCPGGLLSPWVWLHCALAARRRVSELASDLATCSPTCPTSAGLVSSVCACSVASRVLFFATHWTAALQVPLSMGSSRQEHWSGLPCPPPGDLPGPGSKPVSPISPALAGVFFNSSAAWEGPPFQWLPATFLA